VDAQSSDPGRRRFLGGVTTALLAAIGGTVAAILGGAVISPRLLGRREDWLPAASLDSLQENQPLAVTLRVARRDGYRQIVDRKTVFVVKTGNSGVIALDSTCTHLGCRVRWDPDQRLLLCPCHGGVYGPTGAVKAGPPPAPLQAMSTRVDGNQVLVQI
jgi:menaquinol-cytochrome c reductase iron-sulfur subunit